MHRRSMYTFRRLAPLVFVCESVVAGVTKGESLIDRPSPRGCFAATMLMGAMVGTAMPSALRASEPMNAPALEAASTQQPEALSVEVLSRLGPEMDDEARKAVRGAVVAAIAKRGVVVDDAAAPELVILVRWKEAGSSTFEARFAYAPNSSAPNRRVAELECTCDGATLAGRIAARVEALLPELANEADHHADVASTSTTTEPTLAPDPEPEPATPSPTPERPRRLNTLGWTGVGLTGGGLAAVVIGSVLVSMGKQGKRDATNLQVVVRDFRTPGWVTLGLGAAAAITGGVLIGVDGARARQSRARTQTRVVPTIARMPGGAIVGAVGRW